MEYRPPLHLGVVAIEKGAFGSPSTMVANFTYLCWNTVYFFNDVQYSQNLEGFGSISSNFLNFSSDTIEKLGIINFRSYCNKSNASIVLSDSEVTFLWKVDGNLLIHRIA